MTLVTMQATPTVNKFQIGMSEDRRYQLSLKSSTAAGMDSEIDQIWREIDSLKNRNQAKYSEVYQTISEELQAMN